MRRLIDKEKVVVLVDDRKFGRVEAQVDLVLLLLFLLFFLLFFENGD